MSSKGMEGILEPLTAGVKMVTQIAGTGVQLAGAGVSAGAAASKSIADKAAYETQAAVLDANAELDRAAASDAIRRGQTASVASQLKTKQTKGQQIAAMAANGLALDEGSPLEILTSTDLTGLNDTNLIALNAEKEAWGYGIKAANNDRNAAVMRMRAGMENPKRAATGSLLTSASQVASKWYSNRLGS